MSFIYSLPIQAICPFFTSQGRETGLRRPARFLKSRTANVPALSALLLSAVFTAGCGGTPDHPADAAAGDQYLQTANASHAPARSASAASASSFTVNPTENFNGFNPEVWNSQQSWVECNCGNNKPAEPQIMTWNPGA